MNKQPTYTLYEGKEGSEFQRVGPVTRSSCFFIFLMENTDVYDLAPSVPCEGPCFFAWECDKAPSDCSACQLAETVIPFVGEVRPDPIPPWRGRVFDWRNVAIVMLLGLVLVLTAAVAKSPAPLPGSTTTRAGAAARGQAGR